MSEGGEDPKHRFWHGISLIDLGEDEQLVGAGLLANKVTANHAGRASNAVGIRDDGFSHELPCLLDLLMLLLRSCPHVLVCEHAEYSPNS
jgi:hypothetical protein